MKKPVLTLIFLIGIIISLSIVKVILYNRLSTSGIIFGKTEEEINNYKTQNAILSEKLLTFSSLTNIAVKAEQLGFTKKDSLIVIGKSPLAIKQ